MQLTDKQIQEYIDLHKKKFGETISREEAIVQATKLLDLVKLVYKPIKKDSDKR